ncbi:hypothetical protein BKA59DRAFT_532086 [Fusarium tricinctum]|uniref:Uncharacterized protein n=1 Tax=Fusarium tricinctum TaxID=61284 RepID=A0A8K0RUK8_9HYPO|nr:hypothetical protein BKA59DRAFT_532086 [Fusarium tricinctum]
MEIRSQKHVPKHTTLSPKKSCLKPSTSRAVTLTDSDDDASIETRLKELKWVRFINLAKIIDIDGVDILVPDSPAEQLDNRETESDDRSPEFMAQDEEIERRLNRATDICEANERASLIRGSLDFLMVICNGMSNKPNRVAIILERLGPRSIGSYVGKEREFTECRYSLHEVPEDLYRDKETSMSWGEGWGYKYKATE